MRKKDGQEVSSEAQEALRAAHEALDRGDPVVAQRHLDRAIQHHAPHHQVSRLSVQIQTATAAQRQRAKSSAKRGFWAALLCYLLISFKQPLGWGMPVWIFLAFLLAPGIVGLIVGLQQKILGSPGTSFWTGFKSAFWVVAFYTIFHLLMLGGSHSDAADRAQERIAGVLATLLYATVAGLVAGLVSAAVVFTSRKEQPV